jgi:hypothetical protein
MFTKFKKDKISKLIADIPEKKKREFKAKCGQEGRTIKEVLEYLVGEYLNEKIQIGKK